MDQSAGYTYVNNLSVGKRRMLNCRLGFRYRNDRSLVCNEVFCCMKNEKGQTWKKDNKDMTSVSLVVVVVSVFTIEATYN